MLDKFNKVYSKIIKEAYDGMEPFSDGIVKALLNAGFVHYTKDFTEGPGFAFSETGKEPEMNDNFANIFREGGPYGEITLRLNTALQIGADYPEDMPYKPTNDFEEFLDRTLVELDKYINEQAEKDAEIVKKIVEEDPEEYEGQFKGTIDEAVQNAIVFLGKLKEALQSLK